MGEFDTRIEAGTHVIEKWNAVFRALLAEPRRQLIVSLLDASPDQTVPLPESAINPNIPVDSRKLQKELYHQHLPMLADQGFIDWEIDPLIATRGPKFDQVAIVFEALHSKSADMPNSLIVGCQRLEQERQNKF
ncbi:hypothetical protein [Natrinema ejinorense]|uniref:Transcriptional regulator n=1 Tax=Natrinema ejinorense TaxID=373386 RepID=A0A2A5QQC5_9EURY|nr:hypothetical protein [Natrinema ejinorense]PCR88943.1 hypothetical protein CP557_20940 [Natrinema ejinorense]